MKNLANETHVSLPTWSVPNAVVFEVAIAIISALVIYTTCNVLKYVYLKGNRSRTDLLFAVTSITDIGCRSVNTSPKGYRCCVPNIY